LGFPLVYCKIEKFVFGRKRMTSDDVISAAQIAPGFCEDLSTWRITISLTGLLRQEVSLSTSVNMYRGEMRLFEASLRKDDVVELLALADRIGFRNFKEHYTHETMIVTDLPTCSLSVRFGNQVRTVEAYGPQHIAIEEGNRDMAGFVELLERIHRHAPYPEAEKDVEADDGCESDF
jgi:hypothetical protein